MRGLKITITIEDDGDVYGEDHEFTVADRRAFPFPEETLQIWRTLRGRIYERIDEASDNLRDTLIYESTAPRDEDH